MLTKIQSGAEYLWSGLGFLLQGSLVIALTGLLLDTWWLYSLGYYCCVFSILLRVFLVVLDNACDIKTRSWFFSLVTTRLPHSELRTDFRTRSMNLRKPKDSNPHANMAASRSTADDFITAFAQANGLPVYSVSSSPKDAWKGVAGSRFFYFEKDLRMNYRDDPKPDNHLLKMIDVDYYIDSKTLLDHVDESRCACFYTIMPDVLCETTPESTFLVGPDGYVTESHAGSTPYTHYLWNWRIDYVTSTSLTWSDFLPKFTFRHYYVEARRVGLNRYVVCLVPSVTGGLLAHLAWHYLNPEKEQVVRTLSTWKPQHVNGVNVLVTPTQVMLAYPNSTRQFTLTHAQFGELTHAPKLSGSGAQRIINSTETQYELASIGNQLNEQRLNMNPQVYDYREPRSYKIEFSDVTDEKRVKGQNIFRPLIDGAFVPESCKSNDLACIDGRINKLQANRKPVAAKYYDYMKEFITKFEWVPPHSLHPLSEDEVIEESSSSQKNKYRNAQCEPESSYSHKAFQKTEAYPEPKDPRNISAVDPKHVLKLSCYVRVVVKYLKEHCPWYAFGLTPEEMADSVCALLQGGQGKLIEGDFNRYDGTQGPFDVDLNTALFLHLFHESYHDDIRKLRYDLSYAMFVTEYGIRYCTRDTMKSGSADTSEGNTVDHAFCQFAHFRDLGFTVDDSWTRMGLAGGDDGLLRTPSPSQYEKTCTALGKNLKCNVRQPGEPVSFLGRIWTDWNSPKSFFDPYRCLSKLHFSDNSDRRISSNLLAWRKAVGYYVTDNGNFIGHIAQKILEITASGKTDVVERRDWLKGILAENTPYTTAEIIEQFKGKPVFPTESSSSKTLITYEGTHDECFVHFIRQMNTKFGFKSQEIYDWYQAVMRATTLEELPQLCVVPVENPPLAMTIDGQIIGPPMTPAPVMPTVAPPVCYYMFTRRKCSRGDKCKFSHEVDKCCHDFIKGKCTRKACKMPHLLLSAQL